MVPEAWLGVTAALLCTRFSRQGARCHHCSRVGAGCGAAGVQDTHVLRAVKRAWSSGHFKRWVSGKEQKMTSEGKVSMLWSHVRPWLCAESVLENGPWDARSSILQQLPSLSCAHTCSPRLRCLAPRALSCRKRCSLFNV